MISDEWVEQGHVKDPGKCRKRAYCAIQESRTGVCYKLEVRSLHTWEHIEARTCNRQDIVEQRHVIDKRAEEWHVIYTVGIVYRTMLRTAESTKMTKMKCESAIVKSPAPVPSGPVRRVEPRWQHQLRCIFIYIVSQRSGTEIYIQQIALTTPWQLS